MPEATATSQTLDVEETELAERAKKLGIALLSVIPRELDKTILALIPEDTARRYQMVPFKKTKSALSIAMVDPEDYEALNVLRFLAEKEHITIQITLVSKKIFAEIAKYYTSADIALRDAIVSLKKNADENIQGTARQSREGVAVEGFQDAPIANLVETIVQKSIDGRASDIHIEPIENNFRVRFRVDGILQSQLIFPIEIGRAVIARIKILANLKIDEKRKPQDGRFQFDKQDGTSIDLRVSSLPVVEGEKIVMRVLDKSANSTDMEELGLWGRNRTVLEKRIQEPYGVVLLTGPTGSGKTTTLYSFLQTLNKEDRNIVTLEDPVEYYVEGINQSQIKPEIGYTFASGLRSILRQDPNVIMVGEIRDVETAELVIHAALTGHLVFSTLHTNDALGSIPRLIDMGMEPFLLASALQVVAAQRLVRRLCEHCKEEFFPSPEQEKYIRELFEAIPLEEIVAFGFDKKQEMVFARGKGCEKCNQSGYKGRIAIYEVIEVDNIMRAIISDKKGNEGETRQAAINQGMTTMKQNGILVALKKITSLEEIERVTQGSILVDEE
ncbi:MAG: GspE/PulE family protein [Candidatus Moranbacteria bacterium]|nr:GspE/PulE family protein [Candidatus Moranbacteria bacterium]MDD3965398.1 GspE/PulE family protein [Candidatus Moranbacteria bacterium]